MAAVAQSAQAETAASVVRTQGRRILGAIFVVIAPLTLITGLAYYFGYRREEAFASYFGIEPSALGFTTNDYVLRSVDALFVPIAVVLLIAFCAVLLHALEGDRFKRFDLTRIAAVTGAVALILGVALLAGETLESDYAYLQALGPAVGVTLLIYALARNRSVSRHALGTAAAVGIVFILVSLFWAAGDYAATGGRADARALAGDITVLPTATIYSKVDLDIDPSAPGSGEAPLVNGHGSCALLEVRKLRTGIYPFVYSGFTLLLQSGGNYFLTPTPVDSTRWDPELDAVFVIPDDGTIRIQLMRGADYQRRPLTDAAGPHPTFAC